MGEGLYTVPRPWYDDNMDRNKGSNDRITTTPMPNIVVAPSALAVQARLMPARRAQTDARRKSRSTQRRQWQKEC